MTAPTDPPKLDSDARVAAAYEAHYRVLEFIAVQKFRVPEDDVRSVIHEVFLAFLRAGARVQDDRAWLVGAMCNQCRLYWRTAGRTPQGLALDDDLTCDAEDIAQRVDASTLLRRLPRRCREVLRLRFYEDYSSDELAQHFTTTVQYARKMVYRCVAAARVLLDRVVRGRAAR